MGPLRLVSLSRALSLSLTALSLGCLESPPPPRAPPPSVHLVSLSAPSGDLSRLMRVPTLRARFDRPVAAPDPDALILVAGPPSASLSADAARGALSAANAERRLAVAVSLDPDDPATLILHARAPLLPESPLSLLVTWRLYGREGGPLALDDAGTRGRSFPASVAPASACAALASLVTPVTENVPRVAGRLFVRFDRAVTLAHGPALTLEDALGEPVPSRAAMDCAEADGAARCAWLEPAVVLSPGARYTVLPGALVARNGLGAQPSGMTFTTGAALDGEAATVGPSPVCASDEDPRPPFCLRVGDRWVELRATTPARGVLRAEASGGGSVRAALSAPGTFHTLRLSGLSPGESYRVTVWAWGTDGTGRDARAIDGVVTGAPLPSVRITEVVARPRSTSAQEFVELWNEGARPAALSGWSIVQAPTRSVLPEGTVIPPGARALVVGPGFDPRGAPREGDPPVAPGTVMITLAGAVGGRGLRDSGGDLALVDPLGRVVSQVPGSDPSRAPREGVSLVRSDLELQDDDPAAWTWDALGGSTPGGPDRVRE